MGANTKYKDTVFSKLFSKPDILRELYCALDNVSLPKDIPITVNTLQDALVKEKVNDLSFEIGGKIIVLIEHQSTINPNMPLRLLLYISEIYDLIAKDGRIYSKRLIRLPAPEFIVLYNGEEYYPEEGELKLSDAFKNPADLGLPCKCPALEMTVRVININEGRNAEMARKCKELAQYSAFIEKVRSYEKMGMKLVKAIKRAVEYCLKHDILKEFLEQNSRRVVNMVLTQWNFKDAMRWNRKEGREEGLEEGWEGGLEKGRVEGREEGRETGLEEAARNALMNGFSIDQIHEITGLDTDAIRNLGASAN
jgi:hypothetical protein